MDVPINKIVCGDCLEVMRDWPDNCVDLVLTDPPYFLPAQHYQTRTRFKRSFSDLGILESFFRQWFEGIDRILRRDGLLYMFCDGQSYPLFYYYAFFICKAVRPLIWDKLTSVNGYYWRHQHELILFGVRPEKHKIPTGLGDVLHCRAVPVAERRHPAEKPKDLIRCVLENTAKATDIILDPFVVRARPVWLLPKTEGIGLGLSLNRNISKWPNAAQILPRLAFRSPSSE